MERVGEILRRLDFGWVLLVPAVAAIVVFADGFAPNPDSYYHMGCAELYARQGWVSDFRWLGYTALGESFPNVHLLQHVLLAPFAALFEPETAHRLGTLFLSGALAASLYLVLRRWSVQFAGLWTALCCLSSPLLIHYSTFIKGGSTFFILLVWFVDAVWSQALRRTFVLSWLSVYVYVGAPLLLPVVIVYVVIRWIWEGDCNWRLVAAVGAGLLLGLLINPFWPGQWMHILKEIESVFARPAHLQAGVLRGTEWLALSSTQFLMVVLPFAVAWFGLVVWQLSRRERLTADAAAGTVVCFGLLGGSMLAGPKIIYVFMLLSVLFVPLAVTRMGRLPRWLVICALSLSVGNAIHNVSTVAVESRTGPVPRDYRLMAEFLKAQTPAGQMVLAPWDDFPGLFMFEKHNRYVVGMNPEFLQRRDKRRFAAYSLLYSGRVSDPERLLPQFFGDAQYVLVRTKPGSPGDARLLATLRANRHFELAPSPTHVWTVFRLIEGGAQGRFTR